MATIPRTTTATNPYELLSATYRDTTTAWGCLARERRYQSLAWGAATSRNGTITTWTSPNPTAARLIAQATLHRHRLALAAAALLLLATLAYPTFGTIAAGFVCAVGLTLTIGLSTLATTVTSTTLTDSDVILATLLALHPVRPEPTALPAEILAVLGQTAITHHRPDGTVFRPRTQRDRDMVASMLCDLATDHAQGRATATALASIAEHFPDSGATA